jgi:anti-anti-sigma factor
MTPVVRSTWFRGMRDTGGGAGGGAGAGIGVVVMARSVTDGLRPVIPPHLARVKRGPAGQILPVEETTSAESGQPAGGPEVRCELHGDTAHLTVAGELTEDARRPVVRAVTDLLLEQSALRRIELRVAGVGFMNSAGMAVLVQVQKMAAPRGIEVVLVGPAPAVIRPLQLSGLWHRFPVEGVDEGGVTEGQ